MSAQEKLQLAIQTTMEAGYQLNSEAFEFLIQNASTNDPVNIMNLALERIQGLQNKPMFIERSFLEALIQVIEPAPQIQTSEPERAKFPSIPQPQLRPIEEYQRLTETEFYPYAREIPSELKILEDATGKLTSNGTLNEYVLYFQDRFKRIEKLLRQRMDVKAATPIIEALKSPPKTKLKIICMLTEKRDSKNNTILSVEDLQGSATIIVSKKAPEEVKKKALTLLPDQIFCAAIVKTRSDLLMAEDIIFPDVGRKVPQRAHRTSLRRPHIGHPYRQHKIY